MKRKELFIGPDEKKTDMVSIISFVFQYRLSNICLYLNIVFSINPGHSSVMGNNFNFYVLVVFCLLTSLAKM